MHLSNFLKWRTQPLYEALVEQARRRRLSGATVLSGMAGYVGRGPVLDARGTLQVERPVVLEIVDEEEKLRRFLEAVEPMLEGHAVLVTLERAHVVHYRGGPEGAA